MTTYYLSASQGQAPISEANYTAVAEGTSAPTADVVVTLGGGNTVIGGLSRDLVCKILKGIENYIKSDGWNGNPVIPMGR